MKLPRDIGGLELAKVLGRYGYQVTRQSGSHLRLTTQTPSEHHLTIPAHAALRLGTLNAIMSEVADHVSREKSELIQELWG
jgi:predicted RNA binding protein YcfA (HicA-like mRNA interferase family)